MLKNNSTLTLIKKIIFDVVVYSQVRLKKINLLELAWWSNYLKQVMYVKKFFIKLIKGFYKTLSRAKDVKIQQEYLAKMSEFSSPESVDKVKNVVDSVELKLRDDDGFAKGFRCIVGSA